MLLAQRSPSCTALDPVAPVDPVAGLNCTGCRVWRDVEPCASLPPNQTETVAPLETGFQTRCQAGVVECNRRAWSWPREQR